MKSENTLKIAFFAVLLFVGIAITARAERMRVAIAKFDNEANAPAELFNTLRSRITDNIINTRKFEVVERQQLNKVLSEQKLAEAGVTEAESAPQSGKLKGAGFVIYGSVLSLGFDENTINSADMVAQKKTAIVELQLRFANAETGKIVSSKTIKARKSLSKLAGSGQTVASNTNDQVLQSSIADAAKKVTAALMDLAYPAKVLKVMPDDTILINLSKEATELDALYEVYEVGEELVDPDTGESLGSTEELLGEVKIVSTKPKYAVAVCQGKLKAEDLAPGMIVRRLDEKIAKKRKDAKNQAERAKLESRF